MTEVFDFIKSELTGYYGVDINDIQLDKKFKELGLDSIDLVEFVMNTEEKFGIVIHDDEVHHDMTLQEYIEMVQRKQS